MAPDAGGSEPAAADGASAPAAANGASAPSRREGAMLIDVHAHFWHRDAGRTDWAELNAARFRAGDQMGIAVHVASVLGTYGFTSPTYFPAPADVTLGNDAMLALCEAEPDRVRMYATVNPNHTAHAVAEIERCVARGAIGVKLLASRRADDPLLDPIAELAAAHRLPILHHAWQHRRHDWPSQEASDGIELARLASRHPQATVILAHIGGGGDWAHTLAAIADVPNVVIDLSGSGVDRGMLDAALPTIGPERMLWACDVTMETGLAKLRALEVTGLEAERIELVRWGNAVRIFRAGAFPQFPAGPQPASRSQQAA